MSYLDDLARALTAVGIRGRRRARILAELADHLRCDPGAELGDPTELARRFADELGTSLARRAALRAFAGLAVAGLLFGVAFMTQAGGALRSSRTATPPLGDLGAIVIVIAPQLAFVAGTLALLRALHHRGAASVSRAEAGILVRRAAVGLLAGIASLGGFALLALAMESQAAGWWVALTLTVSAAGASALLAAVPSVLAAARLRPVALGPPGDLHDDLGRLLPRSLHGRPWRFALVVALAVAVVITAVGVVQSDPFDGALRGLLDGAACLAGFAALGRYLGLRR